MRKILIFLSFALLSASAMAQTVRVQRVIADSSLAVRGHTITQISVDSLFTSATHAQVPTAKAVKDYVLANAGGGGVDTMYLSGDSLFVESGAETFFVVLPGGLTEAQVATIARDSTETIFNSSGTKPANTVIVHADNFPADILEEEVYDEELEEFETIFTPVPSIIEQGNFDMKSSRKFQGLRYSNNTWNHYLGMREGNNDDIDGGPVLWGQEKTGSREYYYHPFEFGSVSTTGDRISVNYIGNFISIDHTGSIFRGIAYGNTPDTANYLPNTLIPKYYMDIRLNGVKTLYSANSTIPDGRIATTAGDFAIQNAGATRGIEIDSAGAAGSVRMFATGGEIVATDSLRIRAGASYGTAGQVLTGTAGFGAVWADNSGTGLTTAQVAQIARDSVVIAVTSDGVTVFGNGTPGDPLRTDPSAQILTVSGPTYQLTSADASIYRTIIFTYDTGGGNVTLTVPDTLATNFYSLTLVKTGTGILTVDGVNQPRQKAAQLGVSSAATLVSDNGEDWYLSGELLENVCELSAIGGTVTYNALRCATATLTLAGDYTLAITNAREGEFLTLNVTQNGTGGHTLAWPAGTRFQGGTPVVVSTAANAEDVAIFYTRASGFNLEIGKGYAE